MKTIILNGSPRKNWNTALMLKEAQKGAASAGAETEYIDLYSLNFTGCRSCMACKRKGAERCRCFWKDDLSPVHALIERLHFCALSYDDYSNYFTGKVNVGIILTMNAPMQIFDSWYKGKAEELVQTFSMLNGEVELLPCCDTLQVNDYSKFSMAGFNETHKKAMRETQFPQDLEKAFQMGVKLGS